MVKATEILATDKQALRSTELRRKSAQIGPESCRFGVLPFDVLVGQGNAPSKTGRRDASQAQRRAQSLAVRRRRYEIHGDSAGGQRV